MKKTFAFIGLGHMGMPIAERLLSAGHGVRAFDINSQALGSLVKQGAEGFNSPKAAAEGTKIVFACLPSPEVSLQVALGKNGVVEADGVSIYVEMSTIGTATIDKIASSFADRNVNVLDSPVSGGPRGARAGTMSVISAGDASAFDTLKPILLDVAQHVFYVGEKPGLAQITKLANNMISAAGMAVACEAASLAVKAGVDANILINVINASTGRNSATMDKFPASILPRTFDYGANLSTMYKDVALCLDEARQREVPMWVGSNVGQMWFHAMAQGRANDDYTTLIKMVEEWAGVTVGGEDQ